MLLHTTKIIKVTQKGWHSILIHIKEVLGLNPGLDTDYPEVSCGFPHFLQANSRIAP
jgi:hypothetical protein